MKKFMKKIPSFLKKNLKVIIALIVGAVVSGLVVYGVAGYAYESSDVYFDNTNANLTLNGEAVTTVQGALDALYKKAGSQLKFPGGTINRTYGDATSNTAISGVTGGSGNYTYFGETTSYISTSGTNITVLNTIPAGTYTYKVVATDNGSGVGQVGTYAINVSKKATTMSLSSTSGTIDCGGSTSITVTTNGDGKISCSTSNDTISSCEVSGTTVTINGVPVQSGNATITVSQAAGANYTEATSQTYNLIINDPVWHNVGNSGSCSNSDNCPSSCNRYYSTSVWSCSTSGSTAPSSASLTSGRYCWCMY